MGTYTMESISILPHWVTPIGYIRLYIGRRHPYADQTGTVFEHRYRMMIHLKRKLDRNEFVHHIDGNKQNNNLSNLILMTPHTHTSHHRKMFQWSTKWTTCQSCHSNK